MNNNLSYLDKLEERELQTELYIASDEGKKDIVEYITTSANIVNRPDMFANFCYPLRAASTYNRTQLLDFLINFPVESIREKICNEQLIDECISNGYIYKNKQIIAYFEKNFSSIHEKFLASRMNVNKVINMYVKGGDADLSYIESFVEKINDKTLIDYIYILTNTIDKNSSLSTKYFANLMKKHKADDKPFDEQLLYIALYHNSEQLLDIAMNKIEDNIFNYMKPDSLANLCNSGKYSIVKSLLVKTEYTPSSDIYNRLLDLSNEKDKAMQNNVAEILKIIEVKNLNNKLDNELHSNLNKNTTIKKKL